MKIIRFNGGLGNQLFQYAYYKKILKQDKQTKADITAYEKYNYQQGLELEKVFGIKLCKANQCEIRKLGYSLCIIDRLCKKFLPKKSTYYKEKTIGYDKEINKDKDLYLDGFWQSYKYFEHISEELQKELKCKISLLQKTKYEIENIKNTNAIAIHVRRMDYNNFRNSHYYVDLSKTDYYKKAISYINEHIDNVTFYVFSDDIQWVKKNMFLENAIYVDWNKKENSYQDMIMMSYCQGIIIANSTFSWWGAWLNPRNIKKMVICPQKWHKVSKLKGRKIQIEDLILPEWNVM